MATNSSRSMSADLLTGTQEGTYQTGAPDRSPVDFLQQEHLTDLHTEWYGGRPGHGAPARPVDLREDIPTQFPVSWVGVQP